jgi:hypothetical protein
VLQCTEVDLRCKQGNVSIELSGNLMLQQPQNVRGQIKALGKPVVDFGSIAQGWWFWGEAYASKPLQATRKDISRGTATDWPGPIGPDDLIWFMGMKTHDQAETAEVRARQGTIELILHVTSPQGKPLRHVTIFQRWIANPPQPQIVGYRVEDADKKVMLRVEIGKVEIDQASNAIVPTRLRLFCPDKLEVTVRVSKPKVCTTLNEEQATQFFTPPPTVTDPTAKR